LGPVELNPYPNATRYRFYYQRTIIDLAPTLAGSAEDPLFVITGLTAGQVYQIDVSAANEGAESELSLPVNAAPVPAAVA
jgi:hypothetical protein